MMPYELPKWRRCRDKHREALPSVEREREPGIPQRGEITALVSATTSRNNAPLTISRAAVAFARLMALLEASVFHLSA